MYSSDESMLSDSSSDEEHLARAGSSLPPSLSLRTRAKRPVKQMRRSRKAIRQKKILLRALDATYGTLTTVDSIAAVQALATLAETDTCLIGAAIPVFGRLLPNLLRRGPSACKETSDVSALDSQLASVVERLHTSSLWKSVVRAQSNLDWDRQRRGESPVWWHSETPHDDEDTLFAQMDHFILTLDGENMSRRFELRAQSEDQFCGPLCRVLSFLPIYAAFEPPHADNEVTRALRGDFTVVLKCDTPVRSAPEDLGKGLPQTVMFDLTLSGIQRYSPSTFLRLMDHGVKFPVEFGNARFIKDKQGWTAFLDTAPDRRSLYAATHPLPRTLACAAASRLILSRSGRSERSDGGQHSGDHSEGEVPAHLSTLLQSLYLCASCGGLGYQSPRQPPLVDEVSAESRRLTGPYMKTRDIFPNVWLTDDRWHFCYECLPHHELIDDLCQCDLCVVSARKDKARREIDWRRRRYPRIWERKR